MKKAKVFNNKDGTWSIICGDNYATIVSIQDYGFLAKSHKQYRVDVKGRTVASMIDHFATAKSIALKHVQGLV